MMLSTIDQMGSENIRLIREIVSKGEEMGLSNELVSAAVAVASAESDLTYDAQNPTSTAWGPFQYVDDGWETGWNRLVRDQEQVNLDVPSDLASSEIRYDASWQIYVALNEFRIYESQFNEDSFPDNLTPYFREGVESLVERGYEPDADLLQYVYLRHNTDYGPNGQVETVISRDFTDEAVASLFDVVTSVSDEGDVVAQDNTPPVVTSDQEIMVNAESWYDTIDEWFSATDAENDTITHWALYDGGPDDQSGWFYVNGTGFKSAGEAFVVTSEEFKNETWFGYAREAGTETIFAAAWDGSDWSDWAGLVVRSELDFFV